MATLELFAVANFKALAPIATLELPVVNAVPAK